LPHNREPKAGSHRCGVYNMSEGEKSEIRKWVVIGVIFILGIGIIAPSSLTFKMAGLLSKEIERVWK
jgi:hypothetical protein